MLRIHGLVKRYGARTVLDGLDLELPAGQWVALLGPNGAGKSTLFQVLTGLFAADAGDVTVDGLSLRTQATQALRHIGVVFQQMSLDLDLSVRRNLQFHADLHGLPPILLQASRAEILRDDTTRFAESARAQGVDVTEDLYDEMPHVWHMFAGVLPEADSALRSMGRWLATVAAAQPPAP